MISPVERTVPIEYGFCSMVGGSIGDRSKLYPLSWGNYFDLVIGAEPKPKGVEELTEILNKSVRVLNMWLENLEEANHRFNLDSVVKIRQYDKHCIVIDERIPDDWKNKKLCFTGSFKPSLEVARDIFSIIGDPNDELLQFIDQDAYMERNGYTCMKNSKNKTIGYTKVFGNMPIKKLEVQE